MKNLEFANNYIAHNNLQNTLQAIAIREFAICLDSQLVDKPVETTKEQPKTGIYFKQEELRPLYQLLNRTNSREHMEDLDIFLERIASCLKG